ncbi:hypothetical protein MH050_09320 [Bacillus licheniformis]|jgi:hypothetical protein|uniref:hypothetical protein n=1 Tax=Bacillus licheniformis TaxID=1402 RepID=UPI0005CF2DEA|nr:hypothetical protein [Bacillus licheniformis]MCA1180449.1 hypothetical protein [Bacillus licheniformis]MCM3210980.1 hypothetical protein [Bacillus licheniformis]MCM3286586.1 hypothetical protein [Bacillus licheniformis]MCQ5304260.1 hypothetical protein [Bacillus licheniformis]MCY7741048.1 hypothetical protein [Bacillus licheniformis]
MLAKADFYYGAFLSQLVNSGFAPAIFENSEKRRIYKLSTNYGDYKVYTKYVSKQSNKGQNRMWHFPFNLDEVNNIQQDQSINMFAFICGVEDLVNSEIVILSREEFNQCIGVGFKTENRRVSVKSEKGAWNHLVYGTGIELKETPLKVIKNLNKRLSEFSMVST